MARRWAVLGLLAALAIPASARADPRFFGRYTGTATVTTSPFYPPGVYEAEVAVAQTASGVVGFVNIAYDPADVIGGTITHTFSARLDGGDTLLDFRYSDRLCGGGDPPDKCYPQAATDTQYSFAGQALFYGTKLTLSKPELLPDLPYATVLPFDVVQVSREPNLPRTSFEGQYKNLLYVWPGTVIVALPLPLFGTNKVRIQNGHVVEWINNGQTMPIPGVISASCFDDEQELGWMNQQGKWAYRFILDPEGRGVGTIVTFTFGSVPNCADLQDPLAGAGLDLTHKNLIGFMVEPAPAVVGPGAIRDLRLDRDPRGGTLELDWAPDCGSGTSYAVYRGDLAQGYASLAAEPGYCAVPTHHASIPAGSGIADFFLVVPNDGVVEGSYGIDSQGNPRPRASEPCYASSLIDSCAP